MSEREESEPIYALTLTCYPMLNECGTTKTWTGDVLREVREQIAAEGWDLQAAACPEHAPRVDRITGEFFRKGKCAACGKSGVERTKTFSGPTMENIQEQADAWTKTPLKHKRCEEHA